MSVIAAIVIGIMMLIDVADVSGRYFFLKPLPGATDMIPLLLVCAGSLGLAHAEVCGSHIAVDFIINRLSRRIQATAKSLGYFIALVAFFLISWQLFLKAAVEASKKEGELGWASEVIGIPFSPFLVIFGIGVGMLCIALLLRLLHSIYPLYQAWTQKIR